MQRTAPPPRSRGASGTALHRIETGAVAIGYPRPARCADRSRVLRAPQRVVDDGVRDCRDREHAGRRRKMGSGRPGGGLEAVTRIESKRKKDGAPQNAARVCVAGEGPVAHTSGSGCDCRDVPHAGNEIAEGEQPSAEAAEQRLRAFEVVEMACEGRAEDFYADDAA